MAFCFSFTSWSLANPYSTVGILLYETCRRHPDTPRLADAVTVVVYNMVVSFMQIERISVRDLGLGLAAFVCVSLGGMMIGFFCGFLTAFLTKYTDKVRGKPVHDGSRRISMTFQF